MYALNDSQMASFQTLLRSNIENEYFQYIISNLESFPKRVTSKTDTVEDTLDPHRRARSRARIFLSCAASCTFASLKPHCLSYLDYEYRSYVSSPFPLPFPFPVRRNSVQCHSRKYQRGNSRVVSTKHVGLSYILDVVPFVHVETN